jgi:hypothetical protein
MPGTFDNLLDVWLSIKYQSPVQRMVCPQCGVALEETERCACFCRFCGWTDSIPLPFIPRNPDSNTN